MEEILHERTFTKEYATATQISQIVKDIIDEHTEFTRVSVDDTNLAIKNKFKEEGVFSLLGKLAETAQFADGTKGSIDCILPFRSYRN